MNQNIIDSLNDIDLEIVHDAMSTTENWYVVRMGETMFGINYEPIAFITIE